MAELNYASYLHLDKLLQLQEARSTPAEHDELLFIVTHQSTELWLKELLHEFDKVKTDFSAGLVAGASATLTRARRILRVLVQHLDVLETMTPLSFSLFRHRLEHASGFQSMQFRELEFVLGIKRAGALDHYPPELAGIETARQRLAERTVVDHLYLLLQRKGVAVPQELFTGDITQPTQPNRVVQDGILMLYISDGEMRVLFELMTDVDEGFQEWRYRHVKMVERTIGNKEGTGGSLGVEFLKASLFVQAFPDLWAIRHRL
jgi:tryptophan 2,3-dioxygenase